MEALEEKLAGFAVAPVAAISCALEFCLTCRLPRTIGFMFLDGDMLAAIQFLGEMQWLSGSIFRKLRTDACRAGAERVDIIGDSSSHWFSMLPRLTMIQISRSDEEASPRNGGSKRTEIEE